MPIRPATYRDVSSIASMFADAFHEDALQVVLYPHRNEFPGDYVESLRHKLLENYWDYKRRIVIAYEIIDGKEVMVSVANWGRAGDGWEKVWGVWGSWDPRLLIHRFIKAYMAVYYRLFTNRATANSATRDNPQALHHRNWQAALFPFIAPFLIPPNTPAPEPTSDSASDSTTTPVLKALPQTPCWSLGLLATRPGYQGQGRGRALVKWGLDLARAENIPAVVVAATNKEGFYQRCGFKNLVGWGSAGEGNPLAFVTGGAVLWTPWPWNEDAVVEEVVDEPKVEDVEKISGLVGGGEVR